jgi:uncharacterized membrane protein
MKRSTVDMLREYLMTASLASVSIVALVLAMLAVFGISEETFQTPAFRTGSVTAIICLVLLTKKAARVAFHSAVANRYATPIGPLDHGISVSRECPGRQLVILHLRFSRRLSDPVDC